MSEAALSVETAQPTRLSEDWLAVIIGLGIFALALLSLAGLDALGWLATTSVWTDPGAALAPASKAYAGLSGGRFALPHLRSRCSPFCPPAPSPSARTSGGSSWRSPPCSRSPMRAGSSAAGRALPR